jgi:acyl-CoA synthetase (AMP-forming)/AMP-acid ligase II
LRPGWEDLVEVGVSTAAGTEADLRSVRTGVPQRAITEHILELADRAGYRAALIDADPEADGTVTTWPQFAETVRAAARGLGRRGLRDADTVGVFVQDAASHATAVHAVRAAGAVAWPIHPATTADIAAQLKACRARLLITSAALAELAIEAAERSSVRQVFAFGEAPGTTPFGSLLEAARHGQLHRSGSDQPAPGHVTAQVPDLAALMAAGGPRTRLTRRDVVVAGPPCGATDAYTSLLDLALIVGATIVAAPLPRITRAMRTYKGTAAIVPSGTQVPGTPADRIFTVA